MMVFFQMYLSFRIWLFWISTLNFRGVLIRKPTRLSHNQALLRPYFLWGGGGSIRGGTLRGFQCATERDFCWIIQRLYGTWNLTICEYSICRISKGASWIFWIFYLPTSKFSNILCAKSSYFTNLDVLQINGLPFP